MKRVLKNFLLVSMPTFLLIYLIFELIVFRFVLPASQLPDVAFDKEFAILKLSTEGPTEGTHSMGKWAENTARWQVNNTGWMSTVNYKRKKDRPRLAVIGDSFVMAIEVNTKDAFPQLLDNMLKDSMEVYSFGMAGSPLSNYLHMAKYVVANFDPDVLLVNVVYNDFAASLHRYSDPSLSRKFWTYHISNDSLITENQPNLSMLEEGRLNRLLKSTATGRYLYHNLKFFKLRGIFKRKKVLEGSALDTLGVHQAENREGEPNRKLIKRAVDYTIKQFKTEFPDRGIIISLDGLRKVINENRPFEEGQFNWARLMLKEVCTRHNVELIDLSIPFQQDFQEHQRPFGFSIDPHWDAYTHQVAAQVFYDYLTENRFNNLK